MSLLDIVLVIGFTWRLTRLVTTDDLVGGWLVHPLVEKVEDTKWEKWADGLLCPFCVGFWIGGAVLASYYIIPLDVWRFVAAVFALNAIVGHVSSRLD